MYSVGREWRGGRLQERTAQDRGTRLCIRRANRVAGDWEEVRETRRLLSVYVWDECTTGSFLCGGSE